MEIFESLPVLVQQAIAIGIGGAAFFVGVAWLHALTSKWWQRFDIVNKRIDTESNLRRQMQEESALKLAETRAEIMEDNKRLRTADREEAVQELTAVASNFAKQQTIHEQLIITERAEVAFQTERAVNAERQLEQMSLTIDNLLKRIETVENTTDSQGKTIKKLTEDLNTEQRKNIEKDELLAKLRIEVMEQSDEIRILTREKEAMITIATLAGLKKNMQYLNTEEKQ